MPLIDLAGLGHFKDKENEMIAADYSATKTYAVGDYVYYNGVLKRCTTAITTAEAYTAAHWTNAVLAGDVTDLKTAVVSVENVDKEVIPFTIASSGYIKHNNGDTASSTSSSYTDYVDITNFKTILYKRNGYTANTASSGMAFYNANKTFISGVTAYVAQVEQGYATDLFEMPVPENAKYARFTTFTDTATYGNFELYGKRISTKNIESINKIDTDITEDSDSNIVRLAFNKTYTGYGLTFTHNDDGSITVTGKSTSRSGLFLVGSARIDHNVKYFVSRIEISADAPTEGDTPRMWLASGSSTSNATALTNNDFNTIPDGHNIYVLAANNTTFHNYKFTVQVYKGPDARDYVPPYTKTAVDVIARNRNTKLPRTGAREYFTVPIRRPLPFGGTTTYNDQTAENVECVLQLPTTYTEYGAPTRLVLACHCSGGYIKAADDRWDVADHTNWSTFINTLVNTWGFACFDANIFATGTKSDNLIGEHYGSPLYVNVLRAAYNYIVKNYNVYPEIFVHGSSMGSIAASCFSHLFPQIVLAESSFASRDFLFLLYNYFNSYDATTKLQMANAFGYDTAQDLEDDYFSHCVGFYPSLSLEKYDSNNAIIPMPDRTTAFANWQAYYNEIYGTTYSGTISGRRAVPFKAWNSTSDSSEASYLLERKLAKAYNFGNSVPYYCVEYDEYTHNQMVYGNNEGMVNQLSRWYRQFTS